MDYHLKIGGIGFRVISNDEIRVEESFAPFVSSDRSQNWDVEVEFVRDYRRSNWVDGSILGQDLLLEYYQRKETMFCVAKGGWKGPIAITVWDPGFTRLVCNMNTADFEPLNNLGSLLRLIPMRLILQHYQISFFHASQIAVEGRGILFTAPSGTGKTTQAKLWRDHRGAEIICNDRTLIRNGLTYGYPMDGSEPVRSNEVYPLAAIVVLGQSQQNQVHRLRPGLALAKLLPQIVFDTWNPQARDSATEQLMKLIEQYPIYQLDCTADVSAVMCLEQRLKEDGVIQ